MIGGFHSFLQKILVRLAMAGRLLDQHRVAYIPSRQVPAKAFVRASACRRGFYRLAFNSGNWQKERS